MTIFALAALMVLFEAKRRAAVIAPTASPAERRKATWTARRERLWMGSVYAFSFVFIVMVTAEFVYTKSVSALSPATEVSIHQRQGDHSADAGLRWRSAPLCKRRKTAPTVRFWLYQKPDGKDRHRVRCLRDLRLGWFLQSGEWRGLQELRGSDQSAIGRNGGRLQSHSR